jgi:SAM-dependent methyltransferase
MARAGLNYSGLFRGLHDISSSTVKETAVGTVPVKGTKRREIYSLHPAVIDQCFQLFTVSACRGLRRKYGAIAVPTFIQKIVVHATDDDLRVKAEITSMERGSFHGHLTARSGDRAVLTLKGFKASALTSDDGEESNTPLISELHWKPHRDFVQMAKHLHPQEDCPQAWPLLEELMLLCSMDHLEKIRVTKETSPHLVKLFHWMENIFNDYKQGRLPFLRPESRLEDLSNEARLARINEIVAQVARSKYGVNALAIHRLFLEASAIFAGDAHPLHILMKDNVLTGLYNIGDKLDFTDAVRTLAHTNPRLRVLEVGAGTGGTTHKVLSALISPYGERMYSSYLYTDISAGFMSTAKERFAAFEGMEYAALDISQDPVGQGLAEGTFDLIVGSNVVHATPKLKATLENLRRLLKPTGRLFLEELCPGQHHYFPCI